MNELVLAKLTVKGTTNAELKAKEDLQVPDPDEKEEKDDGKDNEAVCIKSTDLQKTK